MNKETQAIIWANAETLIEVADIVLKQAINKYNSL